MSVFLPVAAFYAVLLALALWGAWLGWTRSKSPTARYFVVAMALTWAGFTANDAWHSYNLFRGTGLAELMYGSVGYPLYGEYDSCSLCYEGPAGQVYVVSAGKMSDGNYIFSEDAHYALRFKSGTVSFNNRKLPPGCHEGDAQTGDVIRVDQATGFRIEVGEYASCD